MLIPRKRDTFAVLTGDYAGEMFVFYEEQDGYYIFISIPDIKKREVPIDKFNLANNEKFIDFVEKLPEDIFLILEAQYNKNIS
jgi:hypothetical protein